MYYKSFVGIRSSFSIIPKSRRHLSASASDVSGFVKFRSFGYPVLFVQETSVISDRHHGFNLLDRFEDNTDNDDQAGAAEGYGSVEYAPEEEGDDSDNGQA